MQRLPATLPGVTQTPIIRPATADDTPACFDVFWEAIGDLATRLGHPWEGTAAERWPRFASLYGHLADVAAEWWVAVAPGDGTLVAYARSIERGGLFELTEFFVRPGHQAAGVGRALLERAFPAGRGEVRVIIATTDIRAQARYLRAGTAAQVPIFGLSGAPAAAELPPGISVEALRADAARAEGLDEVAAIEREVLEHDRGDELRWLLSEREGYLYRRDGEAIGFGFVAASRSGPVAARRPEDLPAILLHLEGRAHALGAERLAFEIPGSNGEAIRHLLARGWQLDPFFTFLMANRPFGKLDRFIGFMPPFTL